MSSDYVTKSLPAVRLVARTATLDADQLGENIGAMFDSVAAGISHLPGSLATPIATYAETEAGMDVVVGYVYAGDPPAGTEVVHLPAVTAVCGVHLGPMSSIRESWRALHRWVAENGYSNSGPCREHYVRSEGDDQSNWVTELQQPIEA